MVTKIANNPDVREFTLDQKILEQRQHDGEQVYSSRISLRAAGGEVKVQILYEMNSPVARISLAKVHGNCNRASLMQKKAKQMPALVCTD